jgi:RNA polymerase sigma factor (sigma-70 family)
VNPNIPPPQQSSSDSIGLDEVLERKKDEIFAYTRKRVESESVALDLTQTVLVHFIVYWRRRGPFSEEVASKMLYTIAKRRIIDWRKKARKIPAPTEDAVLLENLSQKVPDLAHDVIMRADLARVLSQLTPTQRTVLERVYVDDMDYASAARSLGFTVDNLKYHLKTAKTHAKSLLEQQSSTPTA